MATEQRRILYIQPNNEVGGSDIALLRLIRALDQSRYKPAAVLPGPGPLSEPLQDAGATLHYLPMRPLRTIPSPSYQLGYVAAFKPTVDRLRQLIESERIEFVHTNSLYSIYGAWAAHYARRRHIWHVREIPPAIPLARQAYARMVLGLSTSVVAMTTACVTGLFGEATVPAKVTVMPDGLDLEKWRSGVSGDRIRRELGFSDDVPLVGFIARLDPWKGLDVFLRMAQLVRQRLPAARFLIVGDAPDGFQKHRSRMQALAQSLGLGDSVLFLGWRYRMNDIPDVMAALTVLCHTPIRPEPFGLVLIEAMASGCPVVAPRAGGPAEIVVDDSTGLLAAQGDASGFADRILQLLENPLRRTALIEAAHRRVAELYSSERFAENLGRLYASINPPDADARPISS